MEWFSYKGVREDMGARRIGIVTVLVCLVLLPSWPGTGVAAVPYHVMVDGKELRLDGQVRVVSGRILIPMERLLPAMGIKSIWAESKSIVSLYKGEQLLIVQLGENTAYLNGEAVTTEAAPYRDGQGRIWLPLRLIAQAFDAEVLWNGATLTVWIRTATHNSLTPWSPAIQQGDRTEAAIAAHWAAWAPAYEGPPYVEVPTLAGEPYALGTVQPGLIEDGLNMANFMRYLAGLPADLQLDPELNEQAQHGAVVLAAGKRLTHHPEKPADMEADFYHRGYASTTTSNLALYRIFSTRSVLHHIEQLQPEGPWTLASTVVQYMRDQDANNLPMLGHRRWILNPALQKLGFGFAHSAYTSSYEHRLDRYAVMQVFDQSRETAPGVYETIAWPAEGAFPSDFFQGDDPWSISLDPSRFREPDPSIVRITLTREGDGKQWELDQRDTSLTKDQEFFGVNVQGYGVPYCLIFRPTGIADYGVGSYQVAIEGLKTAQGEGTQLEYTVDFFELTPYMPESILVPQTS